MSRPRRARGRRGEIGPVATTARAPPVPRSRSSSVDLLRRGSGGAVGDQAWTVATEGRLDRAPPAGPRVKRHGWATQPLLPEEGAEELQSGADRDGTSSACVRIDRADSTRPARARVAPYAGPAGRRSPPAPQPGCRDRALPGSRGLRASRQRRRTRMRRRSARSAPRRARRRRGWDRPRARAPRSAGRSASRRPSCPAGRAASRRCG
jgi:hypothetical protein